MALPNIFSKEVSGQLIQRINSLTPATRPQWGKMNAAQMMAHINVSYEMVFEDQHAKPNFLMKMILRLFVKKMVTNEVPYKRNSKTAPAMVIADEKDFEQEKSRLVTYINETVKLGEGYFDNKVSHSFGKMTIVEWNNMFYKHLNHHLVQFGV